MNVLEFMNSKSVAKHLADKHYDFSSQEAAFIVWNSKNKSFGEKVSAWSEIISTMPDCAVRCCFDYPKYPSLHDFLCDYIELVSRIGEDADENSLDGDEHYLFTAFSFMWFDIPTPFCKGDIVTAYGDKYVLIDMANWKKVDYIKNGYMDVDYDLDKIDAHVFSKLTIGDYSDMSAHGYRIMSDGIIDYDFFLELYRFRICKANRTYGKRAFAYSAFRLLERQYRFGIIS